MIQRIQSLILLLSALCSLIIVFYFPVLQNGDIYVFLKETLSYARLCVFLSIGLNIFSIFQFRNRNRQIIIIYIPNSFTPNGDNINDAFGPSVYGISEFEMTIYNKWGQIIYHTTEQNKPWDGTINNNETQAGVYTYSIVATDLKDKPHKFVGAERKRIQLEAKD